jgi:ketosteroid isomerase-like protein
MSSQKAVLEQLAARISAGQFAGLEAFFSDDFRLHDPNKPQWPTGRAGAAQMIEGFAALGDNVRVDVLDTVEEADKVVVRWGVAWTRDGERHEAAIIGVYRFADGLIAEDWGIASRAGWP